jgi:xanthine dehydrogenase molybdenum-binding subunit
MKDGCAPEGSCGACTVMVDGRAVVSCAQPASRVAGRTILTVEGLPPDARDAWARAFIDSGASQCGFCSPGIVMKAEALLRRVPRPSREEIARALAGNLCRCTGYVKVIDAIETVAGARAQGGVPATATPGHGVGDRTGRYEGASYVLGEQPFVGDMTVPGMLHGAIRFADHPRAVVRTIDVSRAAALPGVVAVVTWRDVPGERIQGLLERDWPLLVAEGETTRFVGDALAGVAAATRAVAREAARLIDIAYDVLAPVSDPAAALADGAPDLHERGNLLSRCVIRRGSIDTAMAGAAHVATGTFETQRIEHAFLEPEAALAVPGDPGDGEPTIRLYSQGQGAWEDRRQVASILGLPETSVRVTQVATGGAFGGKEDLGAQGHAALLAHVTGRPVLVSLSRRESLRFHPKRHPLSMAYTVGCDQDGRLVGVKARIVGDTGAYASVGAKVLERAAGHACGAYRVPNVDVEALTVYTNNTPCGAMRGFGVPQVTFAIESLLDDLAERVGIDRWEIRWRNALDTGDRTGTGQLLGPGVGLKQTLLAVRAAFEESRFAGIACGMKNTGIGNGVTERGRAILRPESDGTVTLFHSWTEMGQGIHTVLRQIACEALGLDAGRVRVVVDTEVELDTGETTASRATVLGGMAVLDAAQRLRAALGSGRLEDLAGRTFPGEFLVDWTTPPEGPDSEPVTHLAYGWATQVVVLDETGRIERVVAAQDVGRAINPLIVEGQMQGGVHMGLGYALSEAYELADGVPVTESLKSLGIIPAASMPPVECILIEEPQPEGPFGAKGAGEAVLVPTAAAVAGALRAFDGIRRTRLPMRDSEAARAMIPRLGRTTAAASGATRPAPSRPAATAGSS